MKLGSLFDGIGGWLLAAKHAGIEPVWASEIEAFPIAVTKAHFPDVKHLGNITNIDGANIEPVDIVTMGSPCQDLSIAGNCAVILSRMVDTFFARKYQAACLRAA